MFIFNVSRYNLFILFISCVSLEENSFVRAEIFFAEMEFSFAADL